MCVVQVKHLQIIETQINPFYKILDRAEWIAAWRVYEEVCWLQELAAKVNNKEESKLSKYKKIKKKLKCEKYLEVEDLREMRVLVTQLRGSASALLEVERCSRDVPSQGLVFKARVNRVCPHCDADEVEDEVHFLEICKAWKKERIWLEAHYKEFLSEVYEATKKFESKKAKALKALIAKDRLAIAVLGGGAIDSLKEINFEIWLKWNRQVRIFLLRAVAKKRAIQRKKKLVSP